MYLLQICSALLFCGAVSGGVLILSPKKIEISGLQSFTEETYGDIQKSLGNPKIFSFLLNSDSIPEECEFLMKTKYTSYVPTLKYVAGDAVELNSGAEKSCEEIKRRIKKFDLETSKSVLLIFHNPARVKRELDPTAANVTEATEKPTKERSVGLLDPVLYSAKGKALLFSSRGLLLRIQDEQDLILGSTNLVTTDSRETYTRLIATIPVNDGKILLRFRFPWESGYWRLKSVEVDLNGKVSNLTINKEVLAPRNFSHRCGGETVFTNGLVSLTLYDLQVQPDVEDGVFSDAYNCVPFTTGPIWSGLLVTSILMIGLAVGLTALGSIKTMDKFDNSKTRQLTITIMGE